MKCTANTHESRIGRVPIGNTKVTRRCEREIGHPGLHRFTDPFGWIQEFSDIDAWFPRYNPDLQEVFAEEEEAKLP